VLAREKRLRAGRDWDALFRGGFGVGGPLLSLRVLPTPGRRRVGVSVGKKVGGAVTRNLMKRRIRAVVFEAWNKLPQADIGILVRPQARGADFDDLVCAVSDLAERAAGKIARGER
jgi:ribonuclease P protein component